MSKAEHVTDGWWVSWYSPATLDSFELHAPWWISGWSGENMDTPTIVAAIQAEDEDEVWNIVRGAYDNPPASVEDRFCEPMNADWYFDSDRFPKQPWMEWLPGVSCICESKHAQGGKAEPAKDAEETVESEEFDVAKWREEAKARAKTNLDLAVALRLLDSALDTLLEIERDPTVPMNVAADISQVRGTFFGDWR